MGEDNKEKKKESKRGIRKPARSRVASIPCSCTHLHDLVHAGAIVGVYALHSEVRHGGVPTGVALDLVLHVLPPWINGNYGTFIKVKYAA